MLADGAVLVQAFLEEVQTLGEWSLIFIGGEYSHAVLKTPGEGDFRVQEHLGGRVQAAEPPDRLVDQGGTILAEVSKEVLYARVDGVNRNGELVLMELELFEPSLFFDHAPRAAERFATAFERLAKAKVDQS
jgi:glutathione synthase/RimK-type ligase-like ATP-grasp enzyme